MGNKEKIDDLFNELFSKNKVPQAKPEAKPSQADEDYLEEAVRRGIITEHELKYLEMYPSDADWIMSDVKARVAVMDQVIESARTVREREVKKAEEENRIAVLKAASKMGVSVQVYEQIMLKQFEAKTASDTDTQKLGLEVERARRFAEIEVEKNRVLRENEANREVKLGTLAAIYEAAKRYFDLMARGASDQEIKNAKAHLNDLERRWASLSKA
jgi:hypothetical protein